MKIVQQQQHCPTSPPDALEQQMVGELERCRDELEAVVCKHKIVVEMQNMAEGSRRMREFLECQYCFMQRQPNQDDAKLLGAMIEFNNCLAYQMDHLEARVANRFITSAATTDGTSVNSSPPIDTAIEVQQQAQYHPCIPVSSSLPSKVSSACLEQAMQSDDNDDNDDAMPWEAPTSSLAPMHQQQQSPHN